MEYTSESGACDLMKTLNDQRLAGQFCDIRLVVGGDAIDAHRCVLSACSDYFRALFLGDFGDRSANQCDMSACEYRALEHVVAFMYTGRIKISLHNVDDMLQVADYLCLKDVKCFCSDFLKQHLNAENCVQVKALADRFSLHDIHEDVMDFLSVRMNSILKKPAVLDMPFDYIHPLISDKRLSYIREVDILRFIFRWINHSPDERRGYTKQLIACVDFSYIGSDYIEHNVMVSKDITDVLLPEQRKAVHIKLSQQSYPTRMDDMVACRSRVTQTGDEVQLLFYLISDDRWYTLDNQPECHLLDGLESMAADHGSLYLLLTRREDLCGYMHGSRESKQLWKVSLDRGQWCQMPAPVKLSGQSRLISHVRGLYVIDRTGVIQKLDNTTKAWVTYSGPGFEECPNATMFLLPMSMDRYIYVLRGYSEGYAFDYSEMNFSLHRYDTERYTWTTLAHVDAGAFGVDVSRERFHGYEATTSSLIFKDALGFSRMRYDVITGEWAAVSPEVDVPKFITEIWGSAAYRDAVYFSGRMDYERPVFMLYDHGKSRFKMICPPPKHVSGLLCHVVVPRSLRDALTVTKTF